MVHSGKSWTKNSSKSSMVYCNSPWQVVAVDDASYIASGADHVSNYSHSACSCTVRAESFFWPVSHGRSVSVVGCTSYFCVLPRSKAASSVHYYTLYVLFSWTWISQSTCPDTDGVNHFDGTVHISSKNLSECQAPNYVLRTQNPILHYIGWYVRIDHSEK